MNNENKWEYDYSGLYRQAGASGQSGDTGYVNVGSSGTNAANRYEPQSGSYQSSYTANSYQHNETAADATGEIRFDTQPGGTVPPQDTNPGPAYTAPQAPHRPEKKSAGRSELAGRILTVVLAGVVGFGGGVAGSFVAGGRTGGGKVVMQTVQRGEASSLTTSTGGKNLSLTEVAAIASPSVVVITTEQMVATGGWYGQSRVESGAGSGVVLSADGYIMTNAHVVDGASYITVTISDADYDAVLIGSDSESDIAVLKIEAENLVPVVMGDSDTLAVGETVIAVGNPLGELGGTVTEGIISALNRNVVVEDQEMTLIQTSASVSPGNSGGGLFNMQGELIGVVNAKSSGEDAEGLGFAIPVNTASAVASDLIETGYVSGRPAMGVTIVEINDESAAAYYGITTYGVYVYAVDEGSPAEKAGLKPGDRIISIGDVEVTESSALTGYIADCAVGDTVTLTIARSGKTMQVEVTLQEKSAAAQQQKPQVEEDVSNFPGFGGGRD